MKRTIKLALVHQYLPHYREGVYSALDTDPQIEITFFADPDDFLGIKSSSFGVFNRTILLKNRFFSGATWQKGLLKPLLKGRFDAVIFNGDASVLSTWVGALVARAMGGKVLFWTIGWHRPERGVKKAIRMLFYRLADHLLIYGNVGRELGLRHGFPAHKMTVVYNSVTPSMSGWAVAEDNRLGSLQTGALRNVGAVIRLNSNKRMDLLIQAVSQIRKMGEDVGVILVGTGDDVDNLRGVAAQLDVPLCMPGPVYSKENLAKVYDAIDVTVLPTLAGLTVIQSLAHGTPVVTHDNPYEQVPEFEAIHEGKTGSLYRYGDLHSLAQKIKMWVDHDKCEVAEACRQEVSDRWTPEAQLALITSALQRVCAS